MSLDAREKRVLNPRPLRHYRKRYSVAEFRIGLAVLALLALLGGWVAWRGAHPDPSLFGNAPTPGAAAPAAPAVKVSRGALPEGLAAAGWREGPVSRFMANNLYEKIDGRADFFLSRGFKSLTCVPLAQEASASTTVDVELYDLRSYENALSAFGGEKPNDVTPTESKGTTWYLARNALFLVRGGFYARIVGSDESRPVLEELEQVRAALAKALPVSEGPRVFLVFQDALGIPATQVTYQGENAFSFGFARNVYSALLPDGETELFVTRAASPEAAPALAAQFEAGFLSYGERVTQGTRTWVKDRYLGAFSTVLTEGSMVIGVRGAPKMEEAAKALERLREGVARAEKELK